MNKDVPAVDERDKVNKGTLTFAFKLPVA